MEIYLVHWWPLWLLTSGALFAALAYKSFAAGDRSRRAVSLGLRFLVVFLIVLALSDLRFQGDSGRLAVIYVLDKSKSVPPAVREAALTEIRSSLNAKDRETAVGMVVFGESAQIETSPETRPDFSRIASVVETDRTDIGGALRLAGGAFPGGVLRRVVLLSDGNQNRGDAVREAVTLRASGAVVDVLPLHYQYDQEVRVEKVVTPMRALPDETVPVRVVVDSRMAATAKLYVRVDGAIVAQKQVALKAGKNILNLEQTLAKPGFHTFEVQIDTPGDGMPQNNRGFSYTILGGKPRVLIVDSIPDDARFLKDALEKFGLDVAVTSPAGAPVTAAEFQKWDATVLSNVEASSLTPEQMKTLQAAVRDLGMGLVMVGGEKSFGAGNWNDTPVEEALPVYCEVRQKKILPNGALVLVMHTCEFARGNWWAKKICKEAVNKLTSEDLVGLIYYDFQSGVRWLFELQKAGNRDHLNRLIDRLEPGDMPDFDASLQLANGALRNAPASMKHVVVVSDGDPSPPGGLLKRALSKSLITVTTICINPHPGDSNAAQTMRSLANATGGRAYFPQSPEELPGLLIREAAVVRRNFIKEEEFTPVREGYSEILKGFGSGGLPPLLGRVICSEKPTANLALRSPEGDPVLAHWRYGLGRTVAFTSDAKNRWAPAWVSWADFSKFWGQVLSWSLRTLSKNNFRLSARVEDGKGKITVDALDAKGAFLEGLSMEARTVSPSAKSITVSIRQTGPGRYEGDFQVPEVGTYPVMVTFGQENGQTGALGTGMAMSYSPEFRSVRADFETLKAVAEAGGGKIRNNLQGVFERDLPSARSAIPRWPWLVLAAGFVFLVDVFQRRIMVDWARVFAFPGTALRRVASAFTGVAPPSTATRDASMAALLKRKAEVAQERDAEAALFQASQPEGELPGQRPDPEPAKAAPEAGGSTDEPVQEEENAFTKRLLDAKKRAWKKGE